MAAYLEHAAFKVKDFEWCVNFFQDAFDMPVRLSMGEKPHRKIWLHAGIQLNEDVNFDNADGHCDHFALMTDDFEAALQKCLAHGCVQMDMGENWLKMPNGMVIELLRADNKALQTILDQKPWVD